MRLLYILATNHPDEKSEFLHFAINCKADPRPGGQKIISLDLHTVGKAVEAEPQNGQTAEEVSKTATSLLAIPRLGFMLRQRRPPRSKSSARCRIGSPAGF
jgi:hypothetical protein